MGPTWRKEVTGDMTLETMSCLILFLHLPFLQPISHEIKQFSQHMLRKHSIVPKHHGAKESQSETMPPKWTRSSLTLLMPDTVSQQCLHVQHASLPHVTWKLCNWINVYSAVDYRDTKYNCSISWFCIIKEKLIILYLNKVNWTLSEAIRVGAITKGPEMQQIVFHSDFNLYKWSL